MSHNVLQTFARGLLALSLAGCLPNRLDTQASGGQTGGTGGGGMAVAGAGGAGGGGGGGMVAAGPSTEFVGIYNEILVPRCAPCHVTNMPRSGMLDLGDATTAFTALTTGMTACPAAADKRRVIPGYPDQSYLVLKLYGAQPMAMGCGQRMPRTPGRSMAPSCVDGTPPPAAPPMVARRVVIADVGDAGSVADAGRVADAGSRADAPPADAGAPPGGDAGGRADAPPDAAPQAPPRPCLPLSEVERIRTWIYRGAR